MRLDLPKIEQKILKFWQSKKIFEKSLKKTKNSQKFVFYEGPPFANGLPGIHHLLARAFKDIILRYKTMQGFYVERRAGWDTHGLPTEMAAEKKLGIKSKNEIEKMGIDKFIDECQKNVFTYKEEWEDFSRRIGFWLDFENAYITCSNDYIESLFWILKQIWQKGLLYQDYKVVPYCPRCGTSLSSHEVAQGYKKISEPAIFLKSKVKSQKFNTFLLVWTTTPWTLPGNVALAVNPKFTYVKVKVNSDYLILAKERLNILKEKYELVEEFKGEDLLGLEYEPWYSFIEPDKKAHYIVAGDFVSLEEGTGLVHMAPAFGEDDMAAAKENNLPVLMTLDREGKFKKEVRPWAGLFVKDADSKIIEDLKKRKLLQREEIYEHDYPFCWRCKTPLLYYAKNSWFIKMTAVKKELLDNNKKINWVPDYIKEGRFGEWLREVKDWNLSRERYWGTPLPIWQCQKCEQEIVVGSIKELEELSNKKIKNLHRPFIDSITFKCSKCRGQMKRVAEVIDCWFDSGSMPFSQWHYPHKNKGKIDKGEFYPADFICEGIDQTRGWFYTLLAISTLLGKGTCYKNVICHGLVLDAKSHKMSKSRGNIIVPSEVIDKYGADCARFYFYTANQVGEAKRFDFKDIQDLYRKFFDTIWQSYSFFSIYTDKKFKPKSNFQSKDLLDKWIISCSESLNSKLIEKLDKFDVVSSARLFEDFVDDLSNWYIRRSRKRFQRSDKEKEKEEEASQTLYYVLLKLSRLIAPFTPFFAEALYQGLKDKEESVHLCQYPKSEKKRINSKLEEKMKQAREIVVQALAQRAKAGIKVRQPLFKLEINLKLENELLDLIKQEVNVKKVVVAKKINPAPFFKEPLWKNKKHKKWCWIKLDTKITKDLEQEGRQREIIRNISKMRKELGLMPKDIIAVESTAPIADEKEFLKETNAKSFNLKDKSKIKADIVKEIKLGKEKHYLGIRK